MHTDHLNSALAGRYAIDRLIGEGGMATVYLARDVRHQRKVALKVLRPDLGAVLGVDRFLSEIQVTANLQHPNLLPLFDSGAADSLLFYVMPFIEGESLRARLDREKQLPVEEAVRIATAIASALDYAHRQGVIHRDLKPENILLHEGQPLVADFGIALAVSNAGGARITQTGLSLGTPQYMSPEQATGDRAIDGRTDIYSLGALAYEMLTGDAPHTGSTSQAIIARLLTERPRSIRAARSSVPEHVEAAVERALEKLPADRWATAKEFSEALTGARAVSRTTSATSPGAVAPATPARKLPNVRELVAWSVAAAALVALALMALRPDVPDESGGLALFEIPLPKGIDPQPVGNQASVGLDPEGTTLVFQARDSTGRDPAIFLRRLDDPTIVRIRGTDDGRAPFLSPDGTQLLFSPRQVGAGGTGPAMRVNVLGGTPRVFIDSAPANGQISWAEDGPIVMALHDSLWTMPVDGGPRSLLAKPDSARRHLRYGFPSIVAGGRAAVIAIWKGAILADSIVLGVVTIPDGEVTELDLRGTYPRYSPTGHIVYATYDGWLMGVPFSAKSRRTTGPSFPIAEGLRVGTGGAAAIAVARNGTLAWLGGGVQQGANMVAVTRTGTERSLLETTAWYAHPRVSPDGRQVAVTITTTVGQPAQNPDVWRFDLSSKVGTRITTDSSSLRPIWFPDGERIAFIKRGSRVAGDGGVAMMRPLYRAGESTELASLEHLISVSIGRRGAYAALGVGIPGKADIWLGHLDSLDKPRAFLSQPYQELSPHVSPDGRWLAYVTDRTGRNEVYVQAFPGGGEEVRISLDGGQDPAWSHSGTEVFFRGPTHFMAARLSTTARREVLSRTQLFLDNYGASSQAYDVLPGDQEFVMLRRGDLNSAFPLMVMMNWHKARATGRGER